MQWRGPGKARVELQSGYDPITGKPRRMSRTVHGNDADVERALAQMLLEIGRLPSGGKLTVQQYLDDIYKPALATRVRKNTQAGYESKLDLHVTPTLGQVQLANLEPFMLDRWRNKLVSDMSGRSALNVYRAFNTALNRAVRWRLLNTNPLHQVDPPRARVRDLEVLTAKEAMAYLDAFQGHVLEPLIIVAIATGLRPCELYALTWADIDLAQGEVRVHRGLHQRKGDCWFAPTKSDRSDRTVSLPDWASALLKPLRGLGPLVTHPQGFEGHMRPSVVSNRYRRHLKAKKLTYLPLRDLRHTHATLMLEAGVDLVVLSRRLGHSTVAITDQYYLRPRRSADKAAADAFGKLLAGPGGNNAQAGQGVKLAGDNE